MNILKTPADIFRLEAKNKDLREEDRLEMRDGWGVKSTQKLFRAIEKRRKEGISLVTLISAIGIPQVGTSKAKVMANYVDNDVMEWWALCKEKNQEKWKKIVGDASGRSIAAFLEDEDNYEICEHLVRYIYEFK